MSDSVGSFKSIHLYSIKRRKFVFLSLFFFVKDLLVRLVLVRQRLCIFCILVFGLKVVTVTLLELMTSGLSFFTCVLRCSRDHLANWVRCSVQGSCHWCLGASKANPDYAGCLQHYTRTCLRGREVPWIEFRWGACITTVLSSGPLHVLLTLKLRKMSFLLLGSDRYKKRCAWIILAPYIYYIYYIY